MPGSARSSGSSNIPDTYHLDAPVRIAPIQVPRRRVRLRVDDGHVFGTVQLRAARYMEGGARNGDCFYRVAGEASDSGCYRQGGMRAKTPTDQGSEPAVPLGEL